jgi:flavin-dependent dehydrogenase
VEKEGIRLQQGFRVERLLFDSDRAVGIEGKDSSGVIVQKHARILIGADGRNNLIGRTFGWMKAIRSFRKYAFLTYFENVDDLQNYGEIHLVKNGYVGVAPLNSNLANIALVIDEKFCPDGRTELTEFLLSNLEGTSLYSRLKTLTPLCPVITAGPLAFAVERTSGYGTLLVGDTCGFLDPFTGEGINYAFISATIASSILEECFRQNRFDDAILMNYDRKRKEQLSRKFQIARLLQSAVHSRALSDFLIHRFAKQQSLADTMVSAVGGAIDVTEVWNPRFLLSVIMSK